MSTPSTSHSLFITGTDTEIGKTFVSTALLHAFNVHGLRTAAMKPIAAGAEYRDGKWLNEDACQLADAANVCLPAEVVTPYLLTEPAAPHIVAAQQGVELNIASIVACHAKALQVADIVIVEGVGGFRVPLNATQDTADLALALNLPVVLVVGMRLGCLNHALLTAEAIAARGLKLAGWVANQIDPMMRYAHKNIDTLCLHLSQHYQAPLLGIVPHLQSAYARDAMTYLDIEPLLALVRRDLPVFS